MGGAYLVTWTVLCFHCVTFKQLLNCVFHDLCPSQPRPFAQIKLDTSAQIFTAQGIPSGTEALNIVSNHCVCILWDVVTRSHVFTLQHVLTLSGTILLPAKCWFELRLGMAYCVYACHPTMDLKHTPLCSEDQGTTGWGLHTLDRSTFGLWPKEVFNLNLPTLVFLFFVCGIGKHWAEYYRGCLPHIGSQNKNVFSPVFKYSL